MIRRLLVLFGALLLLGAAPPPQKAVVLSPEDAEKEGKALIAEILSLRPEQGSTHVGTLTIRRKNRDPEKIQVRFTVAVNPTNWSSIYDAITPANRIRFTVLHADGTNDYCLDEKTLAANETMVPFAGSDFWLADLGLEFFRWPGQRLVRKEMSRSRFCKVLESVNSQPMPGGYSKVKSWIDNESGGIVQAEAYDDKGRLLKQFFPKRIEKVEGRYELAEMQISNVQTGSRSVIEFELQSQ